MTAVETEGATCRRCGRPIYRPVVEYALGRRGSAPIRWPQRWRHLDDHTLACEQPADE